MKKQSLILFFMSLFIMLQTEAKVINDTILTTPIGKVQVKIKKDLGGGYYVSIEELSKLLPNPRDYGPFDGKINFHPVWCQSFIPMFKKTYPYLCELVNSGLLYQIRFIVKCEEHGSSSKAFILNANSHEVKYLNEFVKELTKNTCFLTILQKSAREALQIVPANPLEKLPDWAKQEIKEKKADYYWNFLIKIDKATLEKY